MGLVDPVYPWQRHYKFTVASSGWLKAIEAYYMGYLGGKKVVLSEDNAVTLR